MNRDIQIPLALEKKIYSYSRTLRAKYRNSLKFVDCENKPATARLYRELIGQLNRVLECEKAGFHFDLLFWKVDGDK